MTTEFSTNESTNKSEKNYEYEKQNGHNIYLINLKVQNIYKRLGSLQCEQQHALSMQKHLRHSSKRHFPMKFI